MSDHVDTNRTVKDIMIDKHPSGKPALPESDDPPEVHLVLFKSIDASMVHLPICLSEFGPGIEYGFRLVNPPGHLSATLRRSIARTYSLPGNFIAMHSKSPCDQRLPRCW